MSSMAKPDSNHNQIATGYYQATGQRKNMEDAAAVEVMDKEGKPLTVAIVADGVGGSNAGEEASRLTVKTVLNYFQTTPLEKADKIPDLLETALKKANHAVYQEARLDERKQGMGSTATVVIIYENRLFIANVGDSRIYLIQNSLIHQLTQDHNWAWFMISMGRMQPDEAKTHPKSEELVRSIGHTAELEVDQKIYLTPTNKEHDTFARQGMTLRTGDHLLLCSDGLIKSRHQGSGHYVEEKEIVQIVTSRGPEKAARDLVQKAIDRQADDNVSAIVLEMPGGLHRAAPLSLPTWIAPVGVLLTLLIIAIFLYPRFAASSAVEATITAAPATSIPTTESVQPATLGAPAETTVPNVQIPMLELPDGVQWNLATSVNNDITSVVLPDGTTLFLANDSLVKINSITGIDNQNETRVEIKNGRLLVYAPNTPITVFSDIVGQVQLAQGVMGILYSVDSRFIFEVHCLVGGDCIFWGDGTDQVSLMAGQAATLQNMAAAPATYETFHAMAPTLVPLPTATPTPTHTPTPTATPTPTPTRRLPIPTLPPTSPPVVDSDGDGVPDGADNCVNDPGPGSNGGCPDQQTPPPQNADGDGDGVPDISDKCAEVFGDPANEGCPVR